MTTDITELALITKIKKQLENFDTVILKEDEALALVEALEKPERANNSAPAILRQLAEEKQRRGEVAAATAFNYAASALQKELSK